MIQRIENSIMNTGEKVKEGNPGEQLLSRQMSDGDQKLPVKDKI